MRDKHRVSLDQIKDASFIADEVRDGLIEARQDAPHRLHLFHDVLCRSLLG
jgi:hypothetical protein